MKATLRKVFAPLLNIFEAGNEPYIYKPSHRTILLVLGGFFLLFSGTLFYTTVKLGLTGALIPGAVFLAVALTCIIVGSLGTERGVSKIWGSK